jgi:hypothetical protein
MLNVPFSVCPAAGYGPRLCCCLGFSNPESRQWTTCSVCAFVFSSLQQLEQDSSFHESNLASPEKKGLPTTDNLWALADKLNPHGGRQPHVL